MDGSQLNWPILVPVLAVSVGAMTILLLEVLLSSTTQEGSAEQRAARERRLGLLLAFVASASITAAIVAGYVFFASGLDVRFDPTRAMFRVDSMTAVSIVLVGLGALLSVWLSSTYLMALRIDHGEYYALLLLACAGMFVSLSAENLMLLYVGIELMSNPVYALAAFDRSKLRSNEAGLKYFLMGGFASAILLYGIAFLYGATGRLDYPGLHAGIAADDALALAGLGLLFSGLAFKVALVPFHQWAPDVYEGAPTPVTAFMAVCLKTTAVLVLVRIVAQVVPEMGARLHDLFWALAVASIVVGNLMAMIQRSVKRMLAYSSIAHAGYMMVAVASGTVDAYAAMVFYLGVYLFIVLGAFGVVIALASGGREYERIDDLAGIAQSRPMLAAVMTFFMLALAGMPGTAGFWAKWNLFSAAIGAGEISLVILAVLGSVVSLYYYLRVPIAMYMSDSRDEAPTQLSTSELTVLLICVVVVLYLGLFPDARLPGQSVGILESLKAVAGAWAFT
jgi:NADH-quinone oxidoreductase subunit N